MAGNVQYLTPYSIAKNFGHAYNESCDRAPDGSWICLRDGDTMFLSPDWGRMVSALVELHGGKYSLMGCMMNRLHDTHQLHDHAFDTNPNIIYHMQIAKQRKNTYGLDVVPVSSTRIIAGAFMLFPKSVWERHPFREGVVDADVWFNRDIRKGGGKIGLSLGLYIFHLYRMWSDNDPRYEVKHLIK